MFRIGHGYDVHKLTEGRKLIMGGVDIPHSLGLLGHSDADVLLHAISDALIISTNTRHRIFFMFFILFSPFVFYLE